MTLLELLCMELTPPPKDYGVCYRAGLPLSRAVILIVLPAACGYSGWLLYNFVLITLPAGYCTTLWPLWHHLVDEAILPKSQELKVQNSPLH